jgi:hypothetical protein
VGLSLELYMSREAVFLAPTFVATCAIATWCVQVRCQGKGRPFGPTSRRWAIAVIAATTLLSVAGAVILALLGHHVPVALLGLSVAAPGSLCLGKIREGIPERRNAYSAALTLWLGWLLARMSDGMAKDKQEWCESYVDAEWQPDELILAAQFYHRQLSDRLMGEDRKRYRIHAQLKDVENRLDLVLVIDANAPKNKVAALLKAAPFGKEARYQVYVNDPVRLGYRLEHDARHALERLVSAAYLTDLRLERYVPQARRASREAAESAGPLRWHP